MFNTRERDEKRHEIIKKHGIQKKQSFDKDIGPYLVKGIGGIHDKDYLKIIHDIHKIYLQMNPEQKKEISSFLRKICHDN